jgi:hypothetical protein
VKKNKTKGGSFGNPAPHHFDARWAGWIPGANKKGKPCKVWVEDKRESKRPKKKEKSDKVSLK